MNNSQQSFFPLLLMTAFIAIGVGVFFATRRPNPGGVWLDVEQSGWTYAGFIFAVLCFIAWLALLIGYIQQVNTESYSRRLDAVAGLSDNLAKLNNLQARVLWAVLSGKSPSDDESPTDLVMVGGVWVEPTLAFRYIAPYHDGDEMTPVRDAKQKQQVTAVVRELARAGVVQEGYANKRPVMLDKAGAIAHLKTLVAI